MERRRADSIWTEGNPGMRTANNNPENLLEGVSGSGPPSVGSVESRGGGGGGGLLKRSHWTWQCLCMCQYVSEVGCVCARLCELYVSKSLPSAEDSKRQTVNIRPPGWWAIGLSTTGVTLFHCAAPPFHFTLSRLDLKIKFDFRAKGFQLWDVPLQRNILKRICCLKWKGQLVSCRLVHLSTRSGVGAAAAVETHTGHGAQGGMWLLQFASQCILRLWVVTQIWTQTWYKNVSI